MKKHVLNSKIKLLKNRLVHKSYHAQRNTPGYAISHSAKMGVPLQVYNLNHVILVVKCKLWQQKIYIKINVQYKKIRHANKAF